MPLPIAPVTSNSTVASSLPSREKTQNGPKPTEVANTPRRPSQQQRLLDAAFGAFLSNVKKSSAADPLPLKHIGSTDIRAR
ncbi:hypothetical protein [Stenotrophomonas sp.]|uniref:hypothetical protein n=1 Tax=Stenotrophomonas sp. TaxID=69392 RepID=UPI0028A914AC|nr:hypothetical protein [Stenotrophomonas sp.]